MQQEFHSTAQLIYRRIARSEIAFGVEDPEVIKWRVSFWLGDRRDASNSILGKQKVGGTVRGSWRERYIAFCWIPRVLDLPTSWNSKELGKLAKQSFTACEKLVDLGNCVARQRDKGPSTFCRNCFRFVIVMNEF